MDKGFCRNFDLKKHIRKLHAQGNNNAQLNDQSPQHQIEPMEMPKNSIKMEKKLAEDKNTMHGKQLDKQLNDKSKIDKNLDQINKSNYSAFNPLLNDLQYRLDLNMIHNRTLNLTINTPPISSFNPANLSSNLLNQQLNNQPNSQLNTLTNPINQLQNTTSANATNAEYSRPLFSIAHHLLQPNLANNLSNNSSSAPSNFLSNNLLNSNANNVMHQLFMNSGAPAQTFNAPSNRLNPLSSLTHFLT